MRDLGEVHLVPFLEHQQQLRERGVEQREDRLQRLPLRLGVRGGRHGEQRLEGEPQGLVVRQLLGLLVLLAPGAFLGEELAGEVFGGLGVQRFCF